MLVNLVLFVVSGLVVFLLLWIVLKIIGRGKVADHALLKTALRLERERREREHLEHRSIHTLGRMMDDDGPPD